MQRSSPLLKKEAKGLIKEREEEERVSRVRRSSSIYRGEGHEGSKEAPRECTKGPITELHMEGQDEQTQSRFGHTPCGPVCLHLLHSDWYVVPSVCVGF
jgi:hypothetical protein